MENKREGPTKGRIISQGGSTEVENISERGQQTESLSARGVHKSKDYEREGSTKAKIIRGKTQQK